MAWHQLSCLSVSALTGPCFEMKRNANLPDLEEDPFDVMNTGQDSRCVSRSSSPLLSANASAPNSLTASTRTTAAVASSCKADLMDEDSSSNFTVVGGKKKFFLLFFFFFGFSNEGFFFWNYFFLNLLHFSPKHTDTLWSFHVRFKYKGFWWPWRVLITQHFFKCQFPSRCRRSWVFLLFQDLFFFSVNCFISLRKNNKLFSPNVTFSRNLMKLNLKCRNFNLI